MFYSGKYAIFLSLVFFAYWLFLSWRSIPALVRVAFILGASYYFYALLNWKFLALLFLISTIDFLTARFISTSTNTRRRKLLVGVSFIADIGTLAVFKYFNFFNQSLSNLLGKFGWHISSEALQLVLPVGLSFIAFRSLSYVVDTYRNTKEKPERSNVNYLEYLAFVAFFPTIEMGPLTRANQVIPQFRQPPTLTSDEGTHAIFSIFIGAIKIAIGSFIGSNLVNRVFDNPALFSATETLGAIYGYALQIYLNFSGTIDIALASALLLGFRLPINFNSPYRARNMPDFWRRWHITFSEWLRDYVFTTLPGSPRKTFNLYWKAVVTMLIGGLWHVMNGAVLAFVIWGALHGFGIAVNQWWDQRRRRKKRKPRQQWWIKALCVFATFHFVCLAWVFFLVGFRGESVGKVWDVLARLKALHFGMPNLLTPVPIPKLAISIPMLLVLIVTYLAHWIPKNAFDKVRDGFTWLPSPVQAVVILFVVFSLYYIAGSQALNIYDNF